MNGITKEHAVELALEYMNGKPLAKCELMGVFLSSDDGHPCWRVLFEFADNEPELLGLPIDITINVDATTGRTWTLESL